MDRRPSRHEARQKLPLLGRLLSRLLLCRLLDSLLCRLLRHVESPLSQCGLRVHQASPHTLPPGTSGGDAAGSRLCARRLNAGESSGKKKGVLDVSTPKAS